MPVCLSASAVAFCAIRLEPTWMHLGEASGMAASLAIKNRTAVQEIEVRNESDIDFYVRGKGLTPFVHVGLETRASDKEEWQRIRAFHCGTGEEEHLIGPGDSFLAFDELPSEAVGGEYRIRFGGRFISAGQTIAETFYSPPPEGQR